MPLFNIWSRETVAAADCLCMFIYYILYYVLVAIIYDLTHSATASISTDKTCKWSTRHHVLRGERRRCELYLQPLNLCRASTETTTTTRRRRRNLFEFRCIRSCVLCRIRFNDSTSRAIRTGYGRVDVLITTAAGRFNKSVVLTHIMTARSKRETCLHGCLAAAANYKFSHTCVCVRVCARSTTSWLSDFYGFE